MIQCVQKLMMHTTSGVFSSQRKERFSHFLFALLALRIEGLAVFPNEKTACAHQKINFMHFVCVPCGVRPIFLERATVGGIQQSLF